MTVDWDLVEAAFDAVDESSRAFLDTETGLVVAWSDETPSDTDDESKRKVAAEPARFVPMPPPSSKAEWGWMKEFSGKLDKHHLRVRLGHALDSNGAFSRFRTMLAQYPLEKELWITFRQERIRGEIDTWREKLPVRIENPAPWAMK